MIFSILAAVTLIWTAPGDDGNVGTAAVYDVRYAADSAAVKNSWSTATQLTGEPAPRVAGTAETFTFNLPASGTWWFGIRTRDEVGNESATSNIISKVVPDTLPPATITDLR